MAEQAVRLQKYLATAGIASRREAEELIQSGKVYVNGQKASLGQKITPNVDQVLYKNKKVEPPELINLLFHKPRGFLCNNDGKRPEKSLFQHFPELTPYRIVVGLEMQASGIILLSNDGSFKQAISKNFRNIERTFHIRIKGELSEKTQKRLLTGIYLEEKTTRLNKIKLIKKETERTWYEISLLDQRDKILEKLFLNLQHPIQRMVQVGIGCLQDKTIKKGKGRILTNKELTIFKQNLGFQS